MKPGEVCGGWPDFGRRPNCPRSLTFIIFLLLTLMSTVFTSSSRLPPNSLRCAIWADRACLQRFGSGMCESVCARAWGCSPRYATRPYAALSCAILSHGGS